jgi:aspartokinase
METSAVYWETKIKIYGFQKTVDLSMVELTLKAEQIYRWGLCVNELDGRGIHFNLALVQCSDENKLRLCLIFNRKWESRVVGHIQKKIKADAGEYFQVESPVELIYFQGPHFGDRYGIADSAFRILADNHITILASGCSGSAIYLVLPEKSSEKAERFLTSAFEVPQRVNISRDSTIHDR